MNVTQLYGTSQAAAAQALIGGDLIADVRNDLLKQIVVAVANKTSSPGGTGDVVGPASSTDGAVTLWNGTTGKLIKNSTVFITGGGTVALGGFTLTVPATGTAALLGIAQTFSAANIFSVNGAASTPALALTGTPFTGGTATTTKPLFNIEPTGTTSTAWSTSGTMLGVNCSSTFVGNLLDVQKNGSARFKVDSLGSLTCGSSSITGAFALTLVTAYGSVNFNQTGSGDLIISRAIVGPASGFLRFGFSGGTDPILQASASAWTVSQAKFVTQASTTSLAGFNIPAGTAPTSPVNGDMWQDGTDLKFRIGGATKTVTLI